MYDKDEEEYEIINEDDDDDDYDEVSEKSMQLQYPHVKIITVALQAHAGIRNNGYKWNFENTLNLIIVINSSDNHWVTATNKNTSRSSYEIDKAKGGLFLLAYVRALCLYKKPSLVRFDHETMRQKYNKFVECYLVNFKIKEISDYTTTQYSIMQAFKFQLVLIYNFKTLN